MRTRRRRRPQQLFFDLTTSLCWEGAPVGITRVEREIAKRARNYPCYPVRYCFFHSTTLAWYEMSPVLAQAVLDGACWISRDDLRAAHFETMDAGPNDLRNIQESNPAAGLSDAHMIAAARRRLADLPLAEILRVRERNSLIRLNDSGDSRIISVSELSAGKIELGPDVWIVNGGLDWEHKDLRDIRILHEETGFVYVSIIYDLIPILFPQFVIPEYVHLLQHYFGELFWTADYALCISETTKRDTEQYLRDWRMPAIPMRSWPLGSDFSPSSTVLNDNAAGLTPGSYLLYVSTIEPRKNHRTVIDAFEHNVRAGLVDPGTCCVFVGREGWNTDNLLREVRVNPLLKDRILILSGLSDDELVKLYQDARFVVFPSRYEGYGLSLVEAMALGKACISSETGSLKEVGGDAPFYIPPHDVEQWAQVIARFMKDDGLVKRYEKRSRTQHQVVTWDASASLFYDFVHSCMDGH